MLVFYPLMRVFISLNHSIFRLTHPVHGADSENDWPSILGTGQHALDGRNISNDINSCMCPGDELHVFHIHAQKHVCYFPFLPTPNVHFIYFSQNHFMENRILIKIFHQGKKSSHHVMSFNLWCTDEQLVR